MSESIHSAQSADLAEYAQAETARIRKERGWDTGDDEEEMDEEADAAAPAMTELHGDAPMDSADSQPESVGKAEGSDAFTPYASKKTKK